MAGEATGGAGASWLAERLRGRRLLPVAGAHDALSARLGQEAGFDAVWASSFGTSAPHGVPDANILTLTENLGVVRRIMDAVRIPVVADCDNGYGTAIKVIRTVGEFERAVCIEDNAFPKRCSFYGGVRRELVAVEEHGRKIRGRQGTTAQPRLRGHSGDRGPDRGVGEGGSAAAGARLCPGGREPARRAG